MASSTNFDFLGQHDAQLVRLGALAERYFRDDPNTCLIKLRQFGEVLAQLVAAKAGLYRSPDEPQADLLRRLNLERITPRQVGDLFYQLRVTGNRATHDLSGTHGRFWASRRQAAAGDGLKSQCIGTSYRNDLSLSRSPPPPAGDCAAADACEYRS
jgi:type I restriction enzyme R subunit